MPQKKVDENKAECVSVFIICTAIWLVRDSVLKTMKERDFWANAYNASGLYFYA